VVPQLGLLVWRDLGVANLEGTRQVTVLEEGGTYRDETPRGALGGEPVAADHVVDEGVEGLLALLLLQTVADVPHRLDGPLPHQDLVLAGQLHQNIQQYADVVAPSDQRHQSLQLFGQIETGLFRHGVDAVGQARDQLVAGLLHVDS
jgi:hypothetical protein